MSAAAEHGSACDYCGLPIVGLRRRRPADKPTEPVYCCSGCRLAASIVAAEATEGHARRTLLRLGLAIFFAMNVMVFSMALWSRDVYAGQLESAGPLADALFDLFRWLACLFSLPVLWLLGGPVLAGVWQALRRRSITTDLLILLGVAAALVYSTVSVVRGEGHVYFDVGSMVLVFVTLGRWLEASGKLKTGAALDALAKLLPETVHRVRDGLVVDVPRETVQVGDELRVLAGERLAVDGRIIAGSAEIDQQIVTGESHTVTKGPGEVVYSGTLNLDGLLHMEVTAAAGQETVSRLLGLVRNARRAQGHYQRLADRIAGWFVPVVCVVALAAAWWHARAGGLDAGILAGLAVVLIACPCALGLATPMAVWAAMGRAAQGQVLFRTGQALERLATVRAVSFDKTGTLTSGHTAVETLITDDATDRQAVECRAAALAAASTHSLSAAIGRYVGAPVAADAVADVTTIPGKGLFARVGIEGESDVVYLGSRRLIEEAGLAVPDRLQQAANAARGADAPAAYVGWGGRVRGLFLFREELRPEAPGAIDQCRALGLDVSVLTGDHRGRAARLEAALGVPVLAEQLPDEKVAAIERTRRCHGSVAMIGDGINDAPALAASDVGVAMGCGADLSRESAAVCLLSNDLARLPWTVALARRTLRVIRQNLFWAFGYNVIGIAIAAGGRLNPIWSAVAMVVSSLLVISNSLRLARFPEPGSNVASHRELPHHADPPNDTSAGSDAMPPALSGVT